ncbi:hypothetical protein Vretimale_18000 [Volvox reticuliferus]|uniref:Uncharacterized protein n=1 Tax=Volvox reticuliferus TaxID=1737510 RepID=A0A8J4GW48_9CHLO|nr:hypothetical protein Vretimale_18000 [Volvox reticuliferus]
MGGDGGGGKQVVMILSTIRLDRISVHARSHNKFVFPKDNSTALIKNMAIQYQTECQYAEVGLLGQKGANNSVHLVEGLLVDSSQLGCEMGGTLTITLGVSV